MITTATPRKGKQACLRGFLRPRARDLFGDGDISQEEYLKRKTSFEREIAHWETRTTDTQKAAIELRMCMEVLNMIATLWDESADEDRQQLARMIFEEIVYDFDQQRIVHFTLKPWGERFLDLRIALRLMEQDNPDDDDHLGAGDGVRSGDGDGDDSGGSGEEISDVHRGEKENCSSLKSTSDLCPIEMRWKVKPEKKASFRGKKRKGNRIDQAA